MSDAWKRAESEAAGIVGGSRNKRGSDWSQNVPDVEHPLFAVEVKYRKDMPVSLKREVERARKDGFPWVLILGGDVVCFDSRSFWRLIGEPLPGYATKSDHTAPALIGHALIQAISYVFEEMKFPVVFFKAKNQQGMFVFMRLNDFIEGGKTANRVRKYRQPYKTLEETDRDRLGSSEGDTGSGSVPSEDKD